MKQIRFLQPQLLKVASLFSLLVLLFLLTSFVFLTPENIDLTNLVQEINSFLSWPYIMLESVTHVSMPWVFTALWILMFWFLVFYLILLLFSVFKPE